MITIPTRPVDTLSKIESYGIFMTLVSIERPSTVLFPTEFPYILPLVTLEEAIYPTQRTYYLSWNTNSGELLLCLFTSVCPLFQFGTIFINYKLELYGYKPFGYLSSLYKRRFKV